MGDDERRNGGFGVGRKRKAYFDGEDPENIFDTEASATCLVEYNPDCAIDAVTA